MILPELLAGILATDSLQDLGSARVLVHELGDIVDVAVDDDPKALFDFVVRLDVFGGELLRHVVRLIWGFSSSLGGGEGGCYRS